MPFRGELLGLYQPLNFPANSFKVFYYFSVCKPDNFKAIGLKYPFPLRVIHFFFFRTMMLTVNFYDTFQ